MSDFGWNDPGTPGDDEPRGASLPRLEDLRTVSGGYERRSVEEAFDAFHRHAAQLDATLRVLESVTLFRRESEALRDDLRALRSASWGPIPAARQPWVATSGGWRTERRAPDALPRIAVEAAFIVAVALAAGLSGLAVGWVVAIVLASWVVVGAAEIALAAARPRAAAPAVLPPPRRAEPEPAALGAVGATPEPVTVGEDTQAAGLTAVAPEARPEPEPEPGPEPSEAVEALEQEEPPAEPEPEAAPEAELVAAEPERATEADEAEREPEPEPERVDEPEPEPERVDEPEQVEEPVPAAEPPDGAAGEQAVAPGLVAISIAAEDGASGSEPQAPAPSPEWEPDTASEGVEPTGDAAGEAEEPVRGSEPQAPFAAEEVVAEPEAAAPAGAEEPAEIVEPDGGPGHADERAEEEAPAGEEPGAEVAAAAEVEEAAGWPAPAREEEAPAEAPAPKQPGEVVAEERPSPEAAPVVESWAAAQPQPPRRRRLWGRRRAEQVAEPAAPEPPRHVRVVAAEPRGEEQDPWEQAPAVPPAPRGHVEAVALPPAVTPHEVAVPWEADAAEAEPEVWPEPEPEPEAEVPAEEPAPEEPAADGLEESAAADELAAGAVAPADEPPRRAAAARLRRGRR